MRPRNDPQLHLGLAHLGGTQRDPVMASLGNLQASAKRGSVNRGHDRLRRSFQCIDHRNQPRAAPFLAGRDLSELLDVGSGNESSPAADQHDRRHVAIASEGLDRFQNPLRHAGAQGIDRRILDGDCADTVLNAHAN